MAEFYPLSTDNSGISKRNGKRIMGLPERQVYRIGVFLFYLTLFVAISFFSKKVKLPEDPVPVQMSVQSDK